MGFTGKERDRLIRRRYCFYILAIVLGLLLVFLGIVIPILVVNSIDQSRTAKFRTAENDALYHWNQLLDYSFITALSIAFQLEGFVFSNITSIPDIALPPMERIEGQYFTRFDIVATVNTVVEPEVELQALCPGGVISHTFPHAHELVGLDMFEHFPAVTNIAIEDEIVVEGPIVSLLSSKRVISVTIPIFNTTELEIEELQNFWGFVFVEVDINATIINSGLPEKMEKLDMDYILFTVVDGAYVVLSQSARDPLDQENIKEFIESSTLVEKLNQDLYLNIALIKKGKKLILTPAILAVIVCGVGTIGMLFIAVAAIVITLFTLNYEGIEHAPKTPPFAMLIIGPHHGGSLWNLAPDQMSDATEKLAVLLEARMRKFHAYQIPQLQPYSTTYILRSVDDAVRMAFSVIEELQAKPIDDELIHCLGENGRLFLSYAVHWCTSGSVTLDPSSSNGRLRYEGPELLFGAGMWRLSAPNLITLSEAAKNAISLKYVRVQFFRSCSLRAGQGEETMYFVFDPSRPLLEKAKADAERNLTDSALQQRILNPLLPTEQRGGEEFDGTRNRLDSQRRSLNAAEGPLVTSVEEVDRGRGRGGAGDRDANREGNMGAEEIDAINRVLLEPQISSAVSNALRTAFEHQGVTVGIDFESVKVMVYYFFSCFKIMFKPLAAPQRHNIYMRLVTAFGVPQEGLLEHLAAHCAIRYIQQQEEAKTVYWNHHYRLQDRKRGQ